MDRPSLVWRASHRLFRWLLNAFWKLEVKGLENLPETGPLIVASNHISFWDGPLLVWIAGPGRYMRFLTKAELFDNPLVGWYLRNIGLVPLDRRAADVRAVRTAVDLLKGGAVLGVFPEGTRSKDGRPGRPKPGVGFLARESGACVAPAKVINTDKLLRFYPLEVRFGPPMKYSGTANDRGDYAEFARQVMDRAASL